MGRETKLPGADGAPHQRVLDLNYTMSKEPWTELELEDGTVVELRVLVNKVHRLLDQYDPMTGDPGYQIQSGLQVKLHVPEDLKRLPGSENEDEISRAHGMINTK